MSALPSGRAAHHCPWICVRVFKQKFDLLLDDILKKDVFGKARLILHVVFTRVHTHTRTHIDMYIYILYPRIYNTCLHVCMTQVLGYTYVIEFQKRGLPHAHMLLILADAPRTPDEYDKYVCAELCDASTPAKKRLQTLQLKHMVCCVNVCGELCVFIVNYVCMYCGSSLSLSLCVCVCEW